MIIYRNLNFLKSKFNAYMKKKQSLRVLQFCLLLFLLAQQVAAQNRTITGKITNSNNGEPLAGATISEKGTSNNTNTKEDGSFSLTLRGTNPRLVISYVGYETTEINVNNKTTINQALTSSSSTLSDVVVVGYGTLNRKEVTSSITHLGSKDLLTVGGNGALMSLQGKVAGLSVTNVSTADPNSTPSIQLRGVSSRSAGLGPLYVVNGIPGGNIDNINQNDIESIDVLKGGAASAIYGTRGSNGVIVITTKKGTADSRLFYDGYKSFDFVNNKLTLLSRDEFIANKRGTDFGKNTDWLKLLTNNPATSQKHTFQFSGGNGKTNYMASADYRNAGGVDLRASKIEYGSRVNINHTSANNLYAVTLNVAPRYIKTNLSNTSGFNYALTLNPTISPFDSAGRYAYVNSGFFANNPVEAATTSLAQQEIKYLDISGSFRMNIYKALYSTVTVGEISNSFRNFNFTPSTVTNVLPANGGTGRNTASQSLDENDQKSFEWTGNYATDIKKHSIKALAGYSYQQFTSSGFNVSNQQFPSDALTFNNLGSGTWNLTTGVNGTGSYKNSSKLIAFFGRLNYDFDQKYYLSASLRHEGSSKFGYNNKWGDFPGASVAGGYHRKIL